MKNKKIISILLAVTLMLAFVVTGCSKGEEQNSNTNKQPTSVNKEMDDKIAEVEVTNSVANTTSFFGKIVGGLGNLGSAMFSDASYRWAKEIPEEFNGKTHLRAPKDGKVEATVTKAGWAYVLTPATGQDSSQQETLEKQGFEVVKTMTTSNQSIATVGGEKIKNTVLMGKDAKVGDKISYEGWGVLICEGTVKNTTPKHDLSKLERISKRTIVKVNLDTDGQFVFTTNLPDSMDYVNDTWQRAYYAADGGIYVNGELREDIYIAKAHSNIFLVYFPFFEMQAEEGMTLKFDATFTDGVKAIQLQPQTFVYDGMGSWIEQK